MLKLASKFAMDIFPSVIATILGAYIVNHYINNKTPAADPAAAVSTVDPKKAVSKADSKPAEKSADLGNMPEAGVRAKGVSEKSISDKAAADKAVVTPAEKADKPAETASIPPTAPADTRRHAPAPREKAASKPNPAPAAEPVVAAPATAPASEPGSGPDANDLARAAIERLRGSEPRVQESSRTPERPKAIDKAVERLAEPAPVVATPVAPAPGVPSLQPLPPPIMVSTPQVDNKPVPMRANDPLHPTPPADIPDPGGAGAPLDLRADATDQQPPPKRPNVAEDVLSATKKLFNSVIPK